MAATAAGANPADLDPGFHTTGTVLTSLSKRNVAAQSIAVQHDGRIVVAGYAAAEGGLDAEGFLLVRYLPDGMLDAAFGNGGIVLTDFAGSGEARCVRIQTDGKIVAAGTSVTLNGADFALARYHADGTPDLIFNGTGRVITAVSPGADAVDSFVIQPDGKIVAAGTRSNSAGTKDDFAVARYLPTGGLDTAFNGTGIVTTTLGARRDYAGAVLLQPDGHIVVTGSTQTATGNDFAAVRYTSTGLLDPTFGSGGIAILSTAADDAAADAVLQSDGRIVLAGYSFGVGDAEFSAVRLLPDGALDTTFNGSGRVISPVGTGQDIGRSVALQPDGKLVLAGYSQTAQSHDFALLRLLPDGTPDLTFNATGRRLVAISGGFNIAEAVTLQDDGRILVAGFADINFSSRIAVCRLRGDPVPAIAIWRQKYFGSPANSGAGRDLNDADHDGAVNLMEFATGSNPHVPDPAPMDLALSGSFLSVTYQQSRESLAEVSLIPEWNRGLSGTWQSLGPVPEIVMENAHHRVMRTLLPLSSSQLFMRLRTTRLASE